MCRKYIPLPRDLYKCIGAHWNGFRSQNTGLFMISMANNIQPLCQDGDGDWIKYILLDEKIRILISAGYYFLQIKCKHWVWSMAYTGTCMSFGRKFRHMLHRELSNNWRSRRKFLQSGDISISVHCNMHRPISRWLGSPLKRKGSHVDYFVVTDCARCSCGIAQHTKYSHCVQSNL